MGYHRSLLINTMAMAITVSASGYAAQPLPLQNHTLNAISDNFQLLPQKGKQALAQGDSYSLQLIRERRDQNQILHTRMQQYYAGVPVFGGYAVLHSKQPVTIQAVNKDKVLLNGKVYQELEQDLGRAPFNFKNNAALALQHFKAKYQSLRVTEAKATPMIYISDSDKAHWAYQVSALVEYPDKIPERPTMIVDADTFSPFIEWNDIKTERKEVRGRGFGGNIRVKKMHYGKNPTPFLIMSRDEESGICYMDNSAVRVVDMQHESYGENAPMQFSCQKGNLHANIFWTGYQGNGYDRANGAYSPSNDALYSGQIINDLYRQWYGVPPLVDQEGEPMKLIMRVHYGHEYENAFWDGKQMTFGDGGSMLHPLVSLGIGSHEISHGFTEQYSNLLYFGQSGGMNESFSDMAAKAAEYFARGSHDWKIGGDIFKEKSGYEAIRYMDQPSLDGKSIDSADEYYKGMDVHHSSGVYNRLFYLLATTPNWDTHKAFDVMVKANMDYWPPYASFTDGGCGMLNATRDLGYELDDVKAVLAKVAIDYEVCNETQSLL